MLPFLKEKGEKAEEGEEEKDQKKMMTMSSKLRLPLHPQLLQHPCRYVSISQALLDYVEFLFVGCVPITSTSKVL